MKYWFDIALLIFATTYLIVIGIRTFLARRAQTRLAKTADSTSPWQPWFPICLSRSPYFQRWWKWTHFEALGVLVIAPDHIQVMAETPAGEAIRWNIPREQLSVEWVHAGSGNMNPWLRLSHAGDSFYIAGDVRFSLTTIKIVDQTNEATANLCRLLAPEVTPPPTAIIGYALEKNPASLRVVIVFFVLLAYALLDGLFISSYQLVNQERILYLGLFMIPVGVQSHFWLTQNAVPRGESAVLAMLLACVLAGAAYPAAKRIDQLLAGPPQAQDYRLLADKTLTPLDAGLPSLNFTFGSEYWDHQETGSIHSFRLIHGPLGLWQVDLTDLRKAVRAFYKGREN